MNIILAKDINKSSFLFVFLFRFYVWFGMIILLFIVSHSHVHKNVQIYAIELKIPFIVLKIIVSPEFPLLKRWRLSTMNYVYFWKRSVNIFINRNIASICV